MLQTGLSLGKVLFGRVFRENPVIIDINPLSLSKAATARTEDARGACIRRHHKKMAAFVDYQQPVHRPALGIARLHGFEQLAGKQRHNNLHDIA